MLQLPLQLVVKLRQLLLLVMMLVQLRCMRLCACWFNPLFRPAFQPLPPKRDPKKRRTRRHWRHDDVGGKPQQLVMLRALSIQKPNAQRPWIDSLAAPFLQASTSTKPVFCGVGHGFSARMLF
jgi:hypothetical protein